MSARNILLVVITIIVLTAIYGILLYNKPHRKIGDEVIASKVKAEQIFKEYTEDEGKANDVYLDKVIQVEGKIKEIKKDQENNTVLILDSGDEMFGINCTLDKSQAEKAKKLQQGAMIKLKGLCTGMLMDVVLIKCFVINP